MQTVFSDLSRVKLKISNWKWMKVSRYLEIKWILSNDTDETFIEHWQCALFHSLDKKWKLHRCKPMVPYIKNFQGNRWL